jgi:hypothetical protein
MEIKVVLNKKTFITYCLMFLDAFVGISQIKEPVHLSYNILENDNYKYQFIDKNKRMNFYIDRNHFVQSLKDSVYVLSDSLFNENIFISITEFEKFANKERKRLIKIDDSKTIKILFNNDVFETIFLYVKDDKNRIKKYCVIWIEEIND